MKDHDGEHFFVVNIERVRLVSLGEIILVSQLAFSFDISFGGDESFIIKFVSEPARDG
jgi:hypothetical protein